MDFKYKAKVDKKWLRGRSLTDHKEDASEFETEQEPIQVINQLKRDGKIPQKATIKIVKRRESKMINFEKIYRESNGWDDAYDEEPEITNTMWKSLGQKMTVRDACKCGWNSVRVPYGEYADEAIAYYDEADGTFGVDGYLCGPDEELLDMEVELEDHWDEDEDGYPIVYTKPVEF